MKFYYLPHHLGFISISNKHCTLYNENQEAKLLKPVTNGKVYGWLINYRPIKEIKSNIEYYHKNKNKTFLEQNAWIESYWIIT